MKRLALSTALLLAAVFAAMVLWELRRAVVIFLLSLAVAAAVRPAVAYLGGSGFRKALGLTGTYLLIVVGAALLLILTGGVLLGESRRAAGDFIAAYEHMAATWPEDGWFHQVIARRLPDPEQMVAALTGPAGTDILQAVLGSAFSVAESIADGIAVLVLSIYWSIDRVHFERLWLSVLPLRQRAAGREVWGEIEREVGAYFRSEVIQSLIAGGLLAAGYWTLGFRYPALMATVAALAMLLPWVGAPFAVFGVVVLSAPALILGGGTVVSHTLLAVVYTLVVLLLLELYVEPRFFNRGRYNSLVMAVAVIALADQLGILGLVLGPPLAVAVQLLIEGLLRMRVQPPVEERPRPLAGLEDRVAALRAALAATDNPPADLASIVERLAALVAEARHVLHEPHPQRQTAASA